MKVLISLLLTLSLNSFALASDLDKSDQILEEYWRLRAYVAQLKPDYLIADYHKVKSFSDFEIIWILEEDESRHEFIRIFHKKSGGVAFVVSYHRSETIVPGRRIVRRFFGPEPYGFRNDTVDLQSLEYLGSQGMKEPRLFKRDREIMDSFHIIPFKD